MSAFEDRLWSELVREHGDEMLLHDLSGASNATHRRRRPTLLAATALTTAGATAAAVLALSATTTAPAYAVTNNSDGTVTVTLKDISAIAALNAEFARDGIPTRAVPLTATCPVHSPLVTMPSGTDPATYSITIVPRDIPAGYTGVLAAGTTDSGQVVLLMGTIKPPVPSCFNSTPRPLHMIDMAHASPALKAAIAEARTALARVRAANP